MAEITLNIASCIVPIKYGYLYNWYAAVDARNLANTGWSVFDGVKMNTLRDYADPAYVGPTNNVAGIVLKEDGTVYWDSPNSGDNSLNFNARGSGSRSGGSGEFDDVLPAACRIWTTSEVSASNGNTGQLTNTTDYYFFDWNAGTPLASTASAKWIGMSIRLVKDSTTLSHGETGSYIGNDGKVYRTICIDTQEILADHLAETKYRNGDWIIGYDGGVYTPIADGTWLALTTEAMCANHDDEDNVLI